MIIQVRTRYREGPSKELDEFVMNDDSTEEQIEDMLREEYMSEINFNDGWRGYDYTIKTS